MLVNSAYRNSPEPNSSVLADIELQFVPGEQDPIRHLRAIVSRGHISGLMVYPDYFLVLGGRHWTKTRRILLLLLRFVIRVVGYLTVILRGRAGYELIYITNEAVGRVGYYQLISGKSEKNNCFSNSLDFFG